MNFTDAVTLVTGCTSAFSVAICIIVITMVMLLGLCKHFMYRLASYQVAGGLLMNVATGLSFLRYAGLSPSGSSACLIIAFVNVYFTWINLLLTLGMTAHVFSYVVCRKSLAYLEKFYVAFSIIVPLFYSWVPFITHNYGQSDINLGCFIDTPNTTSRVHRDGTIEQYSLFFGPLLLFMTLDMVVITAMAVYVRRRSLVHGASVMSSSLNNPYEAHSQGLVYFCPLLAYPMFYFVIILFPCLLHMLMAFGVPTNKWLGLTVGVLLASAGWIAGAILATHLWCARTYMKRETVPFESEQQTPLMEDSER
eukprot:Em0017g226a